MSATGDHRVNYIEAYNLSSSGAAGTKPVPLRDHEKPGDDNDDD